MIKKHFISAFIITAALIFSSCNAFFNPVRDFMKEEEEKAETEKIELPDESEIDKFKPIKFNSKGFTISEKNSVSGEFENPQFLVYSYEEGWKYYISKKSEYKLSIDIQNPFSDKLSPILYIENDFTGVLSKILMNGFANFTFQMNDENTQLSLELNDIFYSTYCGSAFNSMTQWNHPNEFKFYLYDSENNLCDVIKISIYTIDDEVEVSSMRFDCEGFAVQCTGKGAAKKTEVEKTGKHNWNVDVYLDAFTETTISDSDKLEVIIPVLSPQDGLKFDFETVDATTGKEDVIDSLEKTHQFKNNTSTNKMELRFSVVLSIFDDSSITTKVSILAGDAVKTELELADEIAFTVTLHKNTNVKGSVKFNDTTQYLFVTAGVFHSTTISLNSAITFGNEGLDCLVEKAKDPKPLDYGGQYSIQRSGNTFTVSVLGSLADELVKKNTYIKITFILTKNGVPLESVVEEYPVETVLYISKEGII